MTLFIGKPLIALGDTDSTNLYLKNYIEQFDAQEGMTVTAEFQLAGRGQRGTIWESAPRKNILTSILLKPDFLMPSNQFYLGKAAGLAVYDTIKEVIGDELLTIKWPNDILYNKQKVAGILIENSLQGQKIKYSIAGFGINVNQDEFATTIATSLKLISGKDQNQIGLLNPLFEHLEGRYLQLKNGDLHTIDSEYEKVLYGINKTLEFTETKSDKTEKGTIKGVTEDGLLRVAYNTGERTYGFKEVKYL
ncbi:MAG: biotin--[acetyl-CoA-carboxylase] ligase [Bacteroidota bacterium]|nr:biotin--[acetyl-CoA-carboxylase] ligase [Bacteroidota bacterium]